jgi:putative peptidoglycan lipid II flippase
VSEAPKRPSIVRTALVLLPMQIVLRGFEPVLPLVLAAWFGAGQEMDVYVFARQVFTLAGSLVFSAYNDSAVIPILAEERLARRSELPTLLGSLLAHTLVLGSALAALVGALASGWFAIRYQGAELALALRMVVPFCVLLVAMATRSFFGAVLAAEHSYFVQPFASFVSILANLGVLVLLHGKAGVAVVPVAALAGELVATAVLAWFALRAVGVRMRLGFARPAALVAFAKLASSEVGGGAVTRVNPVVDQLMAGLVAVAGGGTVLWYSGDVAMVPTSLLQATLLPVLLSHLSDDFAANDLAKVRSTVVRALAAVVAILVAVSAGLWLVREPLMRAVFLRGKMTAEQVGRMADLMPYHLVGLASFGALLVLARAHVAVKNSRIMIGMGLLNAGSNVAFNLVLVKPLGLAGLALGTSCVHTLVAVVFWFRFEARLAEMRAAAAVPVRLSEARRSGS